MADEVAHDPSGDARGPADAAGDGGLLSPALRATTIGALALVSLHAFEALALTTVMPTIAHDLDGESLYAMAFTATLAAGIVSIVWSGNLADRRGPRSDSSSSPSASWAPGSHRRCPCSSRPVSCRASGPA